jgi:translocation protein SEC62
MSKRPAPTPASKSSASAAKDAKDAKDAAPASGQQGGSKPDTSKPGAGVPTSAEALLRLVKLMQGSVLYNLGCCCCCSGNGGVEPIVLKQTQVANKQGQYVKGKTIVDWCVENAHVLPFEPTVGNLQIFVANLMHHDFLLKAKVTNKERRIIAPLIPKAKGPASDVKLFKKEFFIWAYEGDESTRKMLLGGIIGIVIFCCLMPAWPRFMKVGVWYMSVTLLLVLIAFIVLRLLIWVTVWILTGWNLTIFPYIFIDNIPISEAFMPWSTVGNEFSSGSWYPDEPGSTMRYFRFGTLVGLFATGYWIYSQPTEYDDYVSGLQGFTDDLYAGNLLSDMSNDAKVNIDKPKYQSLRDILFEEAEEAAEAELGEDHPKNKKKAMPSLEELEAMGDEDEEGADAVAEDILNSILEDEESGELNA